MNDQEDLEISNDDGDNQFESGHRTGKVRIIGAEPVTKPDETSAQDLLDPNDEPSDLALVESSVEPNDSITSKKLSPVEIDSLGSDPELQVDPESHLRTDSDDLTESGSGSDPDSDKAIDLTLPHWTEAPTGQVPAVLDRRSDDLDGSDRWANVPAPTWREKHADWEADSEVFEPSMLADPEPSPGSLLNADEFDDIVRQPWTFDIPESTSRGLNELDDQETVVIPSVSRTLFGSSSEVEDNGIDDSGISLDIKDTDSREPKDLSERTQPSRSKTDSERLKVGSPESSVDDQDSDQDKLETLDSDRLIRADLASDLGEVDGGRRSRDAPDRHRHYSRNKRRDRELLQKSSKGKEQGYDKVPNRSDLERLSTDAEFGSDTESGPDRLAPRHEGRGHPPKHRPIKSGDTVHSGGGSSGRNILLAVVSGCILGALGLLLFKIGPAYTMILVVVVVLLAAAEAFAAFRRARYHPATLLGLFATVVLLIETYNKGLEAFPLVLVVLVAASFLWFILEADPHGEPVPGIVSTVFVFTWIAGFGSFAALLISPGVFVDRHGIAFLLGAIIVTVANDVGALAVGSWIGRRPMAKAISPNKTWEGWLGGAIASIVLGLVVVASIHPWTLSSALVLSLLVAVVAPIGDVSESLIKRQLGVKDISRLLPGHGGVLDRVDGLLFVLPMTYFLVKAFHLG